MVKMCNRQEDLGWEMHSGNGAPPIAEVIPRLVKEFYVKYMNDKYENL
jgi:hypothetical protein